MFISMIPCIACSEATVERLFSYLHRASGYFLRKGLEMETLEHFANVYINKLLEIRAPFATNSQDALNREDSDSEIDGEQ